MKSLNINNKDANALFAAFNALDGHDEPTKVNGIDTMYRVPYALGGTTRRIVAKNMLTLMKIIDDFNAVRKSILFECWPTAPTTDQAIQSLKPSDFPEGAYKLFQVMVNEAMETVDEKQIEFIELPYAVIYQNDKNEFPIFALAELEKHGLIADAIS